MGYISKVHNDENNNLGLADETATVSLEGME
jgi:hypothetical protein